MFLSLLHTGKKKRACLSNLLYFCQKKCQSVLMKIFTYSVTKFFSGCALGEGCNRTVPNVKYCGSMKDGYIREGHSCVCSITIVSKTLCLGPGI